MHCKAEEQGMCLLRQVWAALFGLHGLQCHKKLPSYLQAGALLEFCMSDLDETDALSTAQLVGLPLLPMANGQVATTVPAEQVGARAIVYVPTAAEAQLFARHACGHLLLDVDLLPGELVRRCVSPF